MMTLTKVTNVYRVPTVKDALELRKKIDESIRGLGEITTFKYAQKYVKSKGEIVDDYQLVTATIVFNDEKEPGLNIQVSYREGIE